VTRYTPKVRRIPGYDPRYGLTVDGTPWSCVARQTRGGGARAGVWHELVMTQYLTICLLDEEGRHVSRSIRGLYHLAWPERELPAALAYVGRQPRKARAGSDERLAAGHTHLRIDQWPACGWRSLDARCSSLPARTTCPECRTSALWALMGEEAI